MCKYVGVPRAVKTALLVGPSSTAHTVVLSLYYTTHPLVDLVQVEKPTGSDAELGNIDRGLLVVVGQLKMKIDCLQLNKE